MGRQSLGFRVYSFDFEGLPLPIEGQKINHGCPLHTVSKGLCKKVCKIRVTFCDFPLFSQRADDFQLQISPRFRVKMKKVLAYV